MNMPPLVELRFAVRRLRKDLGSTIASVAALACAIGAAVATWSLVSAVLPVRRDWAAKRGQADWRSRSVD